MIPGELPQSSLIEWLLWLLRRRRRFRVTGASMGPLLQPGDEVFAHPGAYRRRLPQPGEIVVARHPYRTGVKIIKRVVQVDDNGRCHLQGDSPQQSTDSRTFGTVPTAHILGRVTSRRPAASPSPRLDNPH